MTHCGTSTDGCNAGTQACMRHFEVDGGVLVSQWCSNLRVIPIEHFATALKETEYAPDILLKAKRSHSVTFNIILTNIVNMVIYKFKPKICPLF